MMTYTTSQFRAAVRAEIQEAFGSVGGHYVTLGIVDQACRRLEEDRPRSTGGFKIGDTVQILKGKHQGQSAVIRKFDDTLVYVEFMGGDAAAYMPEELIGIALTNQPPTFPVELKAGDRVRVIATSEGMDPPRMGDEGEVIQILTSPNMAEVEFPDGQQVYYLKMNVKKL